MTKATLTLPNGTVITVEGIAEDVQKLIELYGVSSAKSEVLRPKGHDRKQTSKTLHQKDYITQIANLIKDCEESDAIEKNILDKVSAVNKVLLP